MTFIEEQVVARFEVVPTSDLVDVYREKCTENSRIPQKRTLVGWVTDRFPDVVQWCPKYGGAFLYNKTVEKRKIIEILCKKVDHLKSTYAPPSIEEQTRNVGEAIRNEVNSSQHTFVNWPPDGNELYTKRAKVPPLLSISSKYMLTSLKRIEKRKKCRINSICQDIIYTATNAKNRRSKHVNLALSAKRKTGSKHMITWLNKLGHGISYDEVNFVETSLAKKMVKNQQLKSYTPSSVQPSRFLSFVLDNNDINPESLNGKNMHVTNGIIVQREDHSDVIPVTTRFRQCKVTRQRSFQALESPLPRYNTQKRTSHLNGKYAGTDTTFDRENWNVARIFDFIWIVLRKASPSTIPNWTGFNYLLELPTLKTVHKVSYLPAINSSPTDMDIVLEVLMQSEAKAKAMNLPETDLVLDQAIYTKAVEILNNPSHEDLKKFINLRMGAFHTICFFLVVIGKRFGDAGIRGCIIILLSSFSEIICCFLFLVA